MGNTAATRALLLVIAVLAASLAGTIACWAARSAGQSNGMVLIAGGAAFGGALTLFITAFNFVMSPDA